VRTVFFALVFANIVYFTWAHWIDVPPAAVNASSAKLPPLKLVDELPPAEREAAKAKKMALNAGNACLSVGPFADLDSSAHAAALLKAKGFDPRQRAEPGQMSEGYWVYIGGMKSEADTDRALAILERSGIKDALVMPETPDAGRRLSLGLYSERPRAERRADAVRAAGLKAEVAERKLAGTIYWVDLVPPPGMNAVPLQDLFAQGVSTRIAVQPCPAASPSPALPSPAPTGTATNASPQPAARPRTTASNPPPLVAGPPRLR
jgi:SPOR domain